MGIIPPEETRKLNVINHLEEVRRRILWYLASLILAAGAAFSQGPAIMAIVKKPIRDLAGELIFIGPTEAFTAYMKIVFLAGFIISFPVLLYHAWAFFVPALQKNMRRRIGVWFLLALVLFLIGSSFSYFIAIPRALDFLMSFGKKIAVAKISLGKYISFFSALILTGSIVFELPVVIGLLTDAQFLKTSTLRKKRHIAVLGIAVFSAVITPTQDIFNMLLFAVPMVGLYEISILIASAIENKKTKNSTS